MLTEKQPPLLATLDLTSPNFCVGSMRNVDENAGCGWQNPARLAASVNKRVQKPEVVFREAISRAEVRFDDSLVND
jgi:hypothetical protein